MYGSVEMKLPYERSSMTSKDDQTAFNFLSRHRGASLRIAKIIVWVFLKVISNEFFKTNVSCFYADFARFKNLKNVIVKPAPSLLVDI